MTSPDTSQENPLLPPWASLAPVEYAYPFEETHNLRTGPDLHPHLLGLLPYVGVWRGRGQGGYPTLEGDDFHFAQEVRISHDGRPFLFFESRAWIIDEDAKPVRPAGREIGWWRPVVENDRVTDDVEALMTSPTGIMEMYLGKTKGTTQLELVTDLVVRTASSKEVTAGHRLFGIVDGALLYAYDMAAEGLPLTPHLSARLLRVAG